MKKNRADRTRDLVGVSLGIRSIFEDQAGEAKTIVYAAVVRCAICHAVVADVVTGPSLSPLIWTAWRAEHSFPDQFKVARLQRRDAPIEKEWIGKPRLLTSDLVLETRCPDHGELELDRDILIAQAQKPPSDPVREVSARPRALT